ncbi:hypothetical protein CC85DRAFT_283670 [Cutaneotrichosporon oleaginosum]|uniref:SAP domain-containing protein n=1 Tax=Cutaneotrichosporon oleaginosum TaxID=879819 RepID=A0A0J0XTP4_9TREE|nr:uncharacterized protein CC85DRAFT_283670 [Cutaneotrichosporon oleaginosum]KLT44448.1 hypothetical protein CC85DRAFT_283670 [Cutaneotrichosporon oleaginosum]TXT07833.1 hypothetical protein COLE_04757 [Cutaneotrichosporon oleaginosum]
MDELSEHAILWNSAALTSLKRQQLMSLSKRYGLKASGKNVEMVERLYDFGQTLTPSAKAIFDLATQSCPESPTKSPSKPMPERMGESLTPPQAPALTRVKQSRPSTISLARRGSWEVIDSDDASLVEEEEDSDDPANWKSATNGATLDGDKYASIGRGVGSLRSLASSIRRTASRTMSKESPTSNIVFPGTSSGMDVDEPEPVEEILCPSPASTVGIPKRIHEEDSHHRPSTIRLVSPAESMVNILETVLVETDKLPLTGDSSVAVIKERLSTRPLREAPTPTLKDRPSLPILLSPASKATGIYPQIPAFDPTAPRESQAAGSTPEPAMPGSFPGSPVSPSFMFGTKQVVSSDEFSEAGAKLLAELQAKVGGKMTFSAELLKGEDADMSKIYTRSGAASGTASASSSKLSSDAANTAPQKPGSGRAPAPAGYDRYAAAHAREFSKMKSLTSMSGTKGRSASGTSQMKTSASNPGLTSSTAPKRKVDEKVPEATAEAKTLRESKRSKTMPKPKPSVIDMFRTRTQSTLNSPGKAGSRTGLKTSRFGFLRKKAPVSTTPPPVESRASIASEGSYVLPSVDVPEDKVEPSRLRKMSSKPGLSMRAVKSSAPPRTSGRSASGSTGPTPPSTSSTLTTGSSLGTRRGAIPDFGPQKPSFQPLKDNSQDHGSASSRKGSASALPVLSRQASTNSFGSISRSGGNRNLARTASGELRASVTTRSGMSSPSLSNMRSPSNSNLRATSISNMRSPGDMRSPSMSGSGIPRTRSSTLLAPTASSLARRQATVKPYASTPAASASASSTGSGSGTSSATSTLQAKPARRPLPRPPTQTTGLTPSIAGMLQPFGEASSRANVLFESNFHISPTPAKLSMKSPLSSPTKRAAPVAHKSPRRAGVRARASGLSAIKAAGHTDAAAIAQRRSELRGKQERLAQEKELRMMLG